MIDLTLTVSPDHVVRDNGNVHVEREVEEKNRYMGHAGGRLLRNLRIRHILESVKGPDTHPYERTQGIQSSS